MKKTSFLPPSKGDAMRFQSRALLIVPVLLAAAALAGCGSSSKSPAKTSHKSSSAYGYGGSSSSTSSSGAPSSKAVTVTTEHTSLGTVLAAGPDKLTVYMFTAKSCTGTCAKIWPPVTGTPSAGAGASAAKLGTTTGAGGVKQVTYAGHPLFYFAPDHRAGQVLGEGIHSFGGSWYALTPAGTPVHKGAAKPSSAYGGY
jgi:predicted lipoprotein with Yx(FWY)xxD motif